MKKNFILASILAVSALLLSVSCQKIEQAQLLNEVDESMVFTASIEQDIAKTVLTDAYKVNWEAGDKININDAVYSATPKDPSTKADFTKISGTTPSSPYKAVFPSTLYSNKAFAFPATQNYAAGKFNAPMYAEGTSESLSFKNICGVICLSLKGTDKVKSISLVANEAVCGSFTMTDASTVNLTGTGKTVTLNLGADGVQLSSDVATKFYIYLPPKEYSAGMKIIATNTDGLVFKKTTAKAVTVERSSVYTFNMTAEFTLALNGEFSVSASKKVKFSQGNTYAKKNGAAWTWGFYDNQYDYNSLSTAASRTARTSDTEIDLFTWGYGDWSTSPTTTEFLTAHTEEGETLLASEDWSSRIGDGSLWRSLTFEEWMYLLKERDGADTKAKEGVTICGKTNCFVIAPDNFAGTIENSYDAAAWAAAEEAGLVCLPAAGMRYSSSVIQANNYGYYWSSTASGKAAARFFGFDPVASPAPASVESKAMSATTCANGGQGTMTALESAKPFANFESAKNQFKNLTLNKDEKASSLKASAASNGIQQKSQAPVKRVNKTLKANHTAVPVKKTAGIAPTSTNGNFSVTATSVYYYYGEYDMYTEDGVYVFTLKGDLESGKTYTLADMDADYTGFFDWENLIPATAATLKVDTKNGLPYVVGTMTLGGNDYTITYELTITGTINVTATDLIIKEFYYGGYEYKFSDSAWSVDLVIPTASQKTGIFDAVDTDYSVLVPAGGSAYYDGVNIAAVTENIVVSQNDDKLTLTGKVVGENGKEYVLNATYEKPDAKEINITVDNANLNNRITGGYWTIDGQTTDNNNSFMLYFKSKGLQGKFTKEDLYGNGYTWVSDKSSGSTVYYEEISSAEITSAISGDKLVVTGTLNLADAKGNPATVTLNISTPFTQTWGEWTDFAPFDKNTGKYTFTVLLSSTQAKIPVKVRKDNTGFKQFKFIGWSKNKFTDNGIDLIVDMAPDNTCTVPKQDTGLDLGYGENVQVQDYASKTGADVPSTYDPETGVFKLALSYFISLGSFGSAYETMAMDTPPTETVVVNSNSIIVEEDINSSTGAHRGWLFVTEDANAKYIVQVLGTEKYGTFSYANGSLGSNYYNVITKDGTSRFQFTEGEVTIVEDEEGVKLTGLLVGEDNKNYELHWIQPAGVLEFDTDAPFDAEFILDEESYGIKDGVVSISSTNADNQTIALELYVDPSATEIPAGTYVISDTKEAGTALKSQGLSGDTLTKCFAGLRGTSGISKGWFMVEGTVTISYSKYDEMLVSIVAKNSYGQDITVKTVGGVSRDYGCSVRLVTDVK